MVMVFELSLISVSAMNGHRLSVHSVGRHGRKGVGFMTGLAFLELRQILFGNRQQLGLLNRQLVGRLQSAQSCHDKPGGVVACRG
jgi:hypothetical protein